MNITNELLSEKHQTLLQELQMVGGCSNAKKYQPLLQTPAARPFTHIQKTYVVALTHPQLTIMYRIPIVSASIVKNPEEKAKFDNIQKVIAKWIMGHSRVTPSIIPFIRMFLKRHSSTHCIISIPMAFKQEFLSDLQQTGIPCIQVSIDYKNEECPLCGTQNEIPQAQSVVYCSGCGSEFAAQTGY